MLEILPYIEIIEDKRQQAKVRHSLKNIVVIVLFAKLANAEYWEEIEEFAKINYDLLQEYIYLENGVPSHDTIQRVMGSINPECIQKVYSKWNELLNTNEGEKLKKIVCIDGKTMRGNKTKDNKPQHIVSAWCDEEGMCLGQNVVEEKSNEITAIPKLLETLNIKGTVITIDAMGTQKDIAKKIKEKKADYVLALKENQLTLFNDVKEYFEDEEFLAKIKETNYKKTEEKAHAQYEIREYYQTSKINWLNNKEKWKGIKSIGMIRKTILRGDEKIIEKRYYISSLKEDIELFSRAVRQHWSVEIMHWHLDVTFKEDANKTINKIAAQNLNIIHKWCLSILKIFEIGNKKCSLRKKRYIISLKAQDFIRQIMEI